MTYAFSLAVDAPRPAPPLPDTSPRPLVVDLDGTLLRTDALHETLARVAFTHPRRLPAVVSALRHGRAAFKRAAADAADLDCSSLPYNNAVLEMVAARRADGGQAHLVTAADQGIADNVAAYLDCFASATGSDGSVNLKGTAKADALAGRFPAGFDYAGDCAADLPIWRRAHGAILVGGSARLIRRLSRDRPDCATLPSRRASFKGWIKMLRIHQWTKNSLLFVPLVLGHEIVHPATAAIAAIAFILFGIVASATYLVNDLSDLGADRLHPTKRRRALAAGLVPIRLAAALAAAMLLAGVAGSFLLGIGFGVAVSCYLVLTLLYSFRLKREPLVDTTAIAGLFALRIVAGMMLIERPLSLWLITFTLVLFLSLALAKRTSELVQATRWERTVHGRGYVLGDETLTTALGVSSGLMAAIVMVVYLSVDAVPAGLYASRAPLFLIPIIVCLWVMRIWIRAHRGTLNDDPVIYAIRDRGSWLHALAVGGCWAAAVLIP